MICLFFLILILAFCSMGSRLVGIRSTSQALTGDPANVAKSCTNSGDSYRGDDDVGSFSNGSCPPLNSEEYVLVSNFHLVMNGEILMQYNHFLPAAAFTKTNGLISLFLLHRSMHVHTKSRTSKQSSYRNCHFCCFIFFL
jgi:hypothetical protein